MNAPGNACNGLEPIKKRFCFYSFLCQDGFIDWLFRKEERDKATWCLRKRRHHLESEGKGEPRERVAGRSGLPCAEQMGTAISSPPTFFPDSCCMCKGSDEEKKRKYNPKTTFPYHLFPKISLLMLCAFLEIERICQQQRT